MTSRLLWFVTAGAGLCAYAFAVSCGGDDGDSGTQSTGSCQAGICGTGSGGDSSGSGTSSGAGGNAGGCVWECTPWDTQGNGDNGSRTCVEVNGCGTDEGKPVETATLPALDENYYRCQVEPIFDLYCAQLACHGVEPELPTSAGRALRTYHRGRLRVSDTNETVTGCQNNQVPVGDCIGTVDRCGCWGEPHTPTEWQRNYDAARGLALDYITAQPLASIDDSEILSQPLENGGPPHDGIKVWTQSDTTYTTVRAWLDGTGTMGNCNTTN